MPESPKQRIVTLLKFTRQMTNDLLKSIPEDQLTFQASKTDNHPLWTMGHLATSYQWFANLTDGKAGTLPESYDKIFGYKSEPKAGSNNYPPLAEVRRHFEETFQRFLSAIDATSDADLSAAPKGETHGFARDRLDLAEKAAWHEGWHAGQISSSRRAMGLPPLMG